MNANQQTTTTGTTVTDKPKSTAKQDTDLHESAIHFLLRHVVESAPAPTSALAQRHIEALHEANPPAETDTYEDRMQKQREKSADDAAALAKAQDEKDQAELAKAKDKEAAEVEKHRKSLDKASEKK